MSESNTRAEIVEVMAHALCEEPECEKCSLDWRGPRGGVRGCIYDATKSADRALTALEASGRAVVQGWQPMETAPKDGTQFLMLGDPERYGRPVWIDRWWGVNYDGQELVTPRWENAGHHNPPASLLGWQPLPLPPSKE